LPSLQDVMTAFTLLTRLPVSRFGGSGVSDLARGVWAFPVVGLVVGLLGGLGYWAMHRLGAPAFLAASWAFVAILLATGAFHEDGLADTADGFGGGGTRERKLEIMRDSRIGTYGAVAVGLSLLIRISALAALEQPRLVLVALIAAATVGRGAMIVPLTVLPPARSDGMAAGMRDIPRWSATLGLALAGLALLVCLPVGSAIVAALAALATCWALARLARSQIGGHSGDVLGATEVIVECVALTVLAGALG
jgi:adenosylcobinamide-GDP ribazoletransferase